MLISRLVAKFKKRFGPSIQPIKIVELSIGGRAIKIHSNNKLIQAYTLFPNYSQELGRLARLVADKYLHSTLLDIGANVGDTAIIMRNVCSSQIICIEGDAHVYELLKVNTQSDERIHCYCCLLGEENSIIDVDLQQEGTNLTIVPSPTGSRQIVVKKLDDFCQQMSIAGKISLLKIDTEGYDFKILRGAAGILANDRPVIYAEYNRSNTDVLKIDALQEWEYLRKLGYHSIMFFDNYGRYVLSCCLDDFAILADLNRYIKNGAFHYFDFCLFHKEDTELFDAFRSVELAIP